MSNQATFTETFLEACRALGLVRVVLRNGIGMAELFTDLAELEIEGCWANLIDRSSHLHFNPGNLGAVAFRNVESETGGTVPAIWLYGSAGCPVLLFVLDQTRGLEAQEQSATYRQLQQAYGPFMHLVSRAGVRSPTSQVRAAGPDSASLH